jgi:Divergent InlB B-repeat domain
VSSSPATYGTVSGGGTFAEGSSVTVTATPNGTRSFVNWTQNGKVVSTSASYMFTMPSANVTLTAHFK